MSHSREHASEHRTVRQHIVSCIVSILILAVGGGILAFTLLRGQVGTQSDDDDGIPSVETEVVTLHTGGLDIQVDGIVTPFREIEVATEVGGRIAYKGPVVPVQKATTEGPDIVAEEFTTDGAAFRAGDFVKENTVLVVIDQLDYKLEYQRSEQQLAQAKEQLKEFEAENDVRKVAILVKNAERDLELTETEFDGMNENRRRDAFSTSELAQAEKAKYASEQAKQALENRLNSLSSRREGLMIAVKLAEIGLEKARNDLKRTIITAPCSGVIVQDFVEAGSYIQKGAPLFVLEDTSSVEVRCNLKMEDLYWLWHQKPNASNADDSLQMAYQVPHAKARVSYRMAGRKDLEYTWQGELERYDGIGLDERTRTVPCRIVVADPREVAVTDQKAENLASERIHPPALVRGMYVTVRVHANPNVAFVKIPASAVQSDKSVWRVNEGGTLEQIESLPLVQYLEEEAAEETVGSEAAEDAKGEVKREYWLVSSAESGIKKGDRLVTRPMPGMRDNMQVQDAAELQPVTEDENGDLAMPDA